MFFFLQVGLPSIAKRFSGKPILLYGKESSMLRGPGFAELDLNAHAFSYVGRKVKLFFFFFVSERSFRVFFFFVCACFVYDSSLWQFSLVTRPDTERV